MDIRKKEDNMVKRLKDPDDKTIETNGICDLIDSTIKSHHNVWLMTDWHLWRREKKGVNRCHKRSDFNSIIKTVNEIPEEDLLINLGDLVDGEFKDSDDLKDVIKNIKCKKILVRGNNDLFDKKFYKSCGFLYVVDSFIWKNILFTHMPVKNDNELNIHGHIHGYRTYWIPYTNQIDVAAFNGRVEPVKLNSILGKQKSYAKTIKEDPEHFYDESARIKMNGDMFTFVMFSLDKSFIPDPFED